MQRAENCESFLEIAKNLEELTLVLIQLEMCKSTKASTFKGQLEFLHIILAITQPKKM